MPTPTPTPQTRTFRSTSPEATEALGRVLGETLPPNSVVTLDGDLGTGKTCLVRGLAAGLGCDEPVSSPTYTLMDAIEGGRLPLFHFDSWMEGREKALFADGGSEWFEAGGISVIEWAERVTDWLPETRLALRLSHQSPEERRIEISVPGPENPLTDLLGGLTPPPGLVEEGPLSAPDSR